MWEDGVHSLPLLFMLTTCFCVVNSRSPRIQMAESSESSKGGIPELMERLGVSGRQFQNVKLGPGVVGRNSSIAWVGGVVMLAGVIGGVWLHSTLLAGASIAGGILIGLGVPCLNILFARMNPAAAILEGAEFVQYHQMQMTAAKGMPILIGSPPIPTPLELGGRDSKSLPTSGEKQG
jgi:hypothetical protein